jgi:hypothetical protein
MITAAPGALFSGNRTICFTLGLFLFAGLYAGLEAQESGSQNYFPEALRRPERGEAPRYPSDLVIGELGQGSAPRAAYLYARDLLLALIRGAEGAAGISGEIKEKLNGLKPGSFRLGGGRTEEDGCVSFLVRFLGQSESIAGELFVIQEDGKWILDDLILEEKKSLSEIRDSYRYDFSPYERFY